MSLHSICDIRLFKYCKIMKKLNKSWSLNDIEGKLVNLYL